MYFRKRYVDNDTIVNNDDIEYIRSDSVFFRGVNLRNIKKAYYIHKQVDTVYEDGIFLICLNDFGIYRKGTPGIFSVCEIFFYVHPYKVMYEYRASVPFPREAVAA